MDDWWKIGRHDGQHDDFYMAIWWGPKVCEKLDNMKGGLGR
jgi:hypothetical protein